MANPDPEIRPELAVEVAAIVATGRSDFPNQINNVLAFPGIFRGALDAGATTITEGMKVAAAHAIASAVQRGRPEPPISSCRRSSTKVQSAWSAQAAARRASRAR